MALCDDGPGTNLGRKVEALSIVSLRNLQRQGETSRRYLTKQPMQAGLASSLSAFPGQ